MCTVVGHGEDGDLGDGAAASLNPAGSLIDGCQVGVHVSGETSASWHFLSGCGHLVAGSNHIIISSFLQRFGVTVSESERAADLSERLCVRAHIGEDDKHVLLTLIGQVLGRRQCQAGGDDPLDSATQWPDNL